MGANAESSRATTPETEFDCNVRHQATQQPAATA
jgi:hypothetical protein